LVFPNVQELLDNLDDALEKCSPGVLRLSQAVAENLMREALEVARDGVRDGGVPIGALLARPTGESSFEIIARGFNTAHRNGDKTAHAEIVTFRHAAGKIPPEADDVILVSSLEPCVMCLGAACEAAIDTIVYGLKAPADNGTSRLAAPQSPETMMPRIVGDVLADESRALFEEWMKSNSQSVQAPFVKQLLELTG
jgi:tRNA(Arg) A34 adenosine deaminase TadA